MNAYEDEFSDSVAVLALGALPAAESDAVVAHLRTCENCRREYDDLRSVANLVGFEAESTPNELDELSAARMKARVMSAVRADVASHARRTAATVAPARAATWPYYAAAAALVLAVVTSVSTVATRGQLAADEQRIALLQNEEAARRAALTDAQAKRDELAQRLALIVAPGAKHFAVPSGEVIETRGRIVIAFAHLPAAPDGKVYQAWTLARGAKGVAPSLTFTPDAAGNAVIELPEAAGNLAAVALSVEPAGGSKAPTSKPRFVQALS
jgi:hypothetical protein